VGPSGGRQLRGEPQSKPATGPAEEVGGGGGVPRQRHCDRQLVLLRVRRPVAPLRQSKLLFRKEITCLHPIPPFAEALRMSKQKLETSIVYVISCRD
jgi:hypothetical protein